jgi:hypothetical protein
VETGSTELNRLRLLAVPILLHALAACGQRESSATDPFELLQQGEFFAAVEACDLRLMIAGTVGPVSTL